MPKIVCAAIDCAYNDDNRCCTAKKVSLNEGHWHTRHEGFKQFWICKNFKKSVDAKRMERILTGMMGGKT